MQPDNNNNNNNNNKTMEMLLHSLQQHKLYGVKQHVQKCHVTFLLSSSANDDDASYDGVADFLAQLAWNLAIVQIPDDDKRGRTAFVQERFTLQGQDEARR